MLEDESAELTRDGQSIRLIGLTDIGFHPGTLEEKKDALRMALSALLTCLFVGYVIGVDTVEDEVMLSSRFRRRKMYRVIVKYVAPVFIVAILISSVLNSFNIITL